jgi:recombination DNA repair RAD52 pathway protein
MSNGLQVFGFETFNTDEQVDRAVSVLERKLDPRLIKQRDAGKGVKLDYIGGHTVIRLLNEAFGYKWSFEIVQDEIVPSQPKLNKWAKAGEEKYEDQPPVVKVLGRLTVPGLGVKEQYGSKVLIGGASEQEAAFKSASTDAMKKCATLFGIGLELYEDDDESPSTATTVVEPAKPTYNKSSYSKATPSKDTTAAAQQAATSQVSYDPADIAKIKELKAVLGVEQNAQLDPYAREFLDSQSATFTSITPSNIKAFNVFLSKKASNV